MKKADVIAHVEAMYNHLQEAYEIAGGLRDVFSAEEWSGTSHMLKGVCNTIRGRIYEIRSIRHDFLQVLETTKEGEHE